MRALVTGCAGFIGSHLTEALLRDGARVIGIDCFNENYQRPAKLRNLNHQGRDRDRFEFVPIDLSRGDLDEIVAEADVLFHLAAEPGMRPSWGRRFQRYVQNNVIATQLLLDAAQRWPDKRFIYASSSSVYGDAEQLPTPESTVPAPISPYGVTKLTAEHLCQAYTASSGVWSTRLRYFTVYGPRQRPDMAFHLFCKAAVEGEPISVLGDGTQTRDFTYVDDIVAGTLAAADADLPAGGVYNLGGGSRTSVAEVLQLLAGLVDGPLDVRYTSPEPGDMRDTSADTTRAKAALGFRPRTALADGLAAELDWIRKETEVPTGTS